MQYLSLKLVYLLDLFYFSDEAKMAIIVGGVCGAIALFLLIILGVYIYNKRRLGMDGKLNFIA